MLLLFKVIGLNHCLGRLFYYLSTVQLPFAYSVVVHDLSHFTGIFDSCIHAHEAHQPLSMRTEYQNFVQLWEEMMIGVLIFKLNCPLV